jgi:glycosyltransferase involved in cell wall biosynthesis
MARVTPDGVEIDLVLATFGRTDEVHRFLESAAAQTYRRFRIILVDQNDDDRLKPVVSSFESEFPIVSLEAPAGLSRARNHAHPLITGDIVAFPDDDCWYPPDTLERVVSAFDEHPEWDALSGMSCDEEGRPTQLRWDPTPGVVSPKNVWRRAIGFTLFLRRSLVDALGEWDESYGPRPSEDGTIRGGGSDGEYLLRMLDRGFTLGYEPSLRIFHDDFRPAVGDRPLMRKAYFYGLDHSRLLRQYGFPKRYVAWRSAQLVAATGLFLVKGDPGRSRFYAAMARGRARGLLGGAGRGA